MQRLWYKDQTVSSHYTPTPTAPKHFSVLARKSLQQQSLLLKNGLILKEAECIIMDRCPFSLFPFKRKWPNHFLKHLRA